MSIDDRLVELGITLPPPTAPVASYAPAVRSGHLLFLSGHVSRRDGAVVTGRLGAGLDIATGAALSRQIAIDLLGTARGAIGSLDAVRQVIKVVGMVNSTVEFTEQPAVIDGASTLLLDVFGERGRHARSAFGVAQLPLGAAVEIELILDVG